MVESSNNIWTNQVRNDTMTNTCMRCGYEWTPRSESPVRCPNCKSTRWNSQKVTQTCCRCNFTWTQRGKTPPHYCPSCHSVMWNVERAVFTCPKCGKTRTLRANSRTDLCPFCDQYTNPFDSATGSAHPREVGQPITLWASHGMALIYNANGSGEVTLYKDGTLVNKMNFDRWLQNNGYSSAGIGRICHEPEVRTKLEELAEKMNSEGNAYQNKAEIIQELREISKPASEIVALREMGMIPIAISMKLKIPFTKVMDVLNNVPPIRSPEKLEAQDRTPENGDQAHGEPRDCAHSKS